MDHKPRSISIPSTRTDGLQIYLITRTILLLPGRKDHRWSICEVSCICAEDVIPYRQGWLVMRKCVGWFGSPAWEAGSRCCSDRDALLVLVLQLVFSLVLLGRRGRGCGSWNRDGYCPSYRVTLVFRICGIISFRKG